MNIKWIDVNKELPKENTEVLTFSGYVDISYYSEKEFQFNNDRGSDTFCLIDGVFTTKDYNPIQLTHWAYINEPKV